jgi:hypothetical protein
MTVFSYIHGLSDTLTLGFDSLILLMLLALLFFVFLLFIWSYDSIVSASIDVVVLAASTTVPATFLI